MVSRSVDASPVVQYLTQETEAYVKEEPLDINQFPGTLICNETFGTTAKDPLGQEAVIPPQPAEEFHCTYPTVDIDFTELEQADQTAIQVAPRRILHHCQQCPAKFCGKKLLSDHMRKVHGPILLPPQYPLHTSPSCECVFCRTKFEAEMLKKHLSAAHPKEADQSSEIMDPLNNIQTIDCSMQTPESLTFRELLPGEVVVDVPTYTSDVLCLHCNRTFATPAHVRVHMKRVEAKAKRTTLGTALPTTSDERVRCRHCGCTFRNMTFLAKHCREFGLTVGAQFMPMEGSNDVSMSESPDTGKQMEPVGGSPNQQKMIVLSGKTKKKIKTSSKKTFDCPECNKSFTTMINLRGHFMMSASKKLLESTCYICFKQVGDSFSLLRHWLTHVIPNALESKACGACCVVCDSESAGNIHMAKHNGIIRKCVVCSASVRQPEMFRHILTHSRQQPLFFKSFEHYCWICGKTIGGLSWSHLEMHLEKHFVHFNLYNLIMIKQHSGMVICDKSKLKETEERRSENFPTESSNKNNQDGNSLKCPICSEGFRNRPAVYSHLTESASVYPPMCTPEEMIPVLPVKASPEDLLCLFCDDRFVTKMRFKQHFVTHIGATPLSLETLLKTDDMEMSASEEVDPLAISDEEKEVPVSQKVANSKVNECVKCGKKFSLNVAFKAHMKKHLESSALKSSEAQSKQPLQCTVCPKKFSLKVALSQHMKLHLDSSAPRSAEAQSKQSLQCTVCQKKFSLKVALSQHMKIHLDSSAPRSAEAQSKQSLQCTVCQKKFTLKFALCQHMKKHQGRAEKEKSKNEFMSCPICSKKFTLQIAFIKHVKEHEHAGVKSPVSSNTRKRSRGSDDGKYNSTPLNLTDNEDVSEIIPWPPKGNLGNVKEKKSLPRMVDVDEPDEEKTSSEEPWVTIPWSSVTEETLAEFSKRNLQTSIKRKKMTLIPDEVAVSPKRTKCKCHSHHTGPCPFEPKALKTDPFQTFSLSANLKASSAKKVVPTAGMNPVIIRKEIVTAGQSNATIIRKLVPSASLNTTINNTSKKFIVSSSGRMLAPFSNTTVGSLNKIGTIGTIGTISRVSSPRFQSSSAIEKPEIVVSFYNKRKQQFNSTPNQLSQLTPQSVTRKEITLTQRSLFECDECPKKFTIEANLTKHKAVHFQSKYFECEDCGDRYLMKHSLQRHIMKAHHPPVVKPFACDICDKAYEHERDLLLHGIDHFTQKYYDCEFCEKGFFRKKSLEQHEQTHKNSLVCSACYKIFDRFSVLKMHQRECEGKIKCEFCLERFTARAMAKHKSKCGDQKQRSSDGQRMDQLERKPVVLLPRLEEMDGMRGNVLLKKLLAAGKGNWRQRILSPISQQKPDESKKLP